MVTCTTVGHGHECSTSCVRAKNYKINMRHIIVMTVRGSTIKLTVVSKHTNNKIYSIHM